MGRRVSVRGTVVVLRCRNDDRGVDVHSWLPEARVPPTIPASADVQDHARPVDGPVHCRTRQPSM